jgi:hypothetical protein
MTKGLVGSRPRPPLKVGLDVLSVIVGVLVLVVGLTWAVIARWSGSTWSSAIGTPPRRCDDAMSTHWAQ